MLGTEGALPLEPQIRAGDALIHVWGHVMLESGSGLQFSSSPVRAHIRARVPARGWVSILVGGRIGVRPRPRASAVDQ